MNNDKWICTAEVHQVKDGGFKLVLSSNDGLSNPDIAAIVQITLEATAEERENCAHADPTEPQDT